MIMIVSLIPKMPRVVRLSILSFLILNIVSTSNTTTASNNDEAPIQHFLHSYATETIEQIRAAYHSAKTEHASKKAMPGHHGARFTAE